MLEQAKTKLEMSMAAQKKEHRREVSAKDDELEDARTSTQKKVEYFFSLMCSIGLSIINIVHNHYIHECKNITFTLFYVGKGPRTTVRIRTRRKN